MRVEEYQSNQFRVVSKDKILGTINEIGNYQFIKNGTNSIECDEAFFEWLVFLNDPQNFEVKAMIYNHQEFMRGLNEWSADECMVRIMEDDEDEDIHFSHHSGYEDRELSPMSEAFTDALMDWCEQ